MIPKYYINRKRGQTPSGAVIFKIAVITDNHIRAAVDENPSAPGAGNGGPRIYYASNSKLRNFVDKVGNRSDLDFVVHLGDACDSPSDWPFFNDEWDKVEQDKFLVIGNHDVEDLDYSQLLTTIGYDSLTEHGGSKFNQYFDYENVRVVFLDSQYDAEDEHTDNSRSRISPDGVEWFESVIADADGHVLVFSHNIPHYRSYPNPSNPYFPDDVAQQIQEIMASARINNPNLKSINWFGGHAHTVEYIAYSNMGQCVGYRLPDSIEYWNENESSVNGMSVINLHENGVVSITSEQLTYPFP